MFKVSKYGLLGLGLAAALLAGCQQKEAETAPAGVTLTTSAGAQQISTAELVARLAQDPLLQEFVQANLAVTTEVDARVAALSPAQRAARKHAHEQVLATHQGWDKLLVPFGTPAQMAEHYKIQQARVDKLKATYGLDKLSSEERSQIMSRANKMIISKMKDKGVAARTDNPCFPAYNECSWSCHDNGADQRCYNACWAGYNACMGNNS